MQTVGDIIHQLIPKGGNDNDLKQCPLWPPDVFAVVATLAKKSDCYCQERFSKNFFDDAYQNRVK